MWRPRKQWCRRRRPVVSKRLVLVLPAEDLRSRQLHISTAELAGCCRARLPRCAPAGTEPPVASAHSSLRDLRVLKAGWVSSRLLFGRSLCGQLLCSRLLCTALAGCSVVMRPVRWVGARSVASQAGLLHEPAPSVNWKCGSEDYVDARAAAMAAYLGRLRACALTAASWLPASTSAHSAPLSSKVSPLLPEPTLTSIRLGCL